MQPRTYKFNYETNQLQLSLVCERCISNEYECVHIADEEECRQCKDAGFSCSSFQNITPINKNSSLKHLLNPPHGLTDDNGSSSSEASSLLNFQRQDVNASFPSKFLLDRYTFEANSMDENKREIRKLCYLNFLVSSKAELLNLRCHWIKLIHSYFSSHDRPISSNSMIQILMQVDSEITPIKDIQFLLSSICTLVLAERAKEKSSFDHDLYSELYDTYNESLNILSELRTISQLNRPLPNLVKWGIKTLDQAQALCN